MVSSKKPVEIYWKEKAECFKIELLLSGISGFVWALSMVLISESSMSLTLSPL